MADALFGAVLLILLLRALSNGPPIELDDLVGLPQLIALSLVAILLVVIFAGRGAAGAAQAVATMALLAVGGLILILFPERMPDTTRGGTLMTAFWSVFGWLMLAVAWTVVLLL